ncbi:MAG: hypothetical protein JWN96_2291 [Mycobacterium sp.]|nr:hypothetical protein [Mycobacterium sp.]
MSLPYEPDLTSYESRPSASVGELLADVSRDFSTLMRQEVELAKAEVKESATKAGKGVGMFAGAGIGGHMVLLFASIALWWGLGDATGHAISALIVAALWAVIAAVLAVMGRTAIKTNPGLTRTTESVKKIPPAVKGDA